MTLKLAFYGGAGTVTGSKFLLTSGRDRILIDCGLFQGLKDLRLRNWRPPPFEPSAVNATVITHAHIDHTGYLPLLVRRGFSGPIYCTPATAKLVEILLLDAAHIQEEDAAYANRKGFSRHKPALPLYTEDDARRALGHLEQVDFDTSFAIGETRVRFQPAGHILGSAVVEVSAPMGDGETTLVFSGDLGRYNVPLHSDPAPRPPCDTLILESTYGNRRHKQGALEDDLVEALRGPLRRGATVLIPSFAVARAQLVTLILRDLIEEGRLPAVPIHIDSPMAVDVTQIYNSYLGEIDLDEDIPGASPRKLFPRQVTFHRTPDESKALNRLNGPRIIISASGMLTGGRVLHHLKRLMPDPGNLIMLVGYQSAGTRGRALQDGAKYLRMHGGNIPVRAKVVTLHGFSAHADQDELIRWGLEEPGAPRTIFLAHGEPSAVDVLAKRIGEASSQAHAVRPDMNDEYVLTPHGAWQRQPEQ